MGRAVDYSNLAEISGRFAVFSVSPRRCGHARRSPSEHLVELARVAHRRDVYRRGRIRAANLQPREEQKDMSPGHPAKPDFARSDGARQGSRLGPL